MHSQHNHFLFGVLYFLQRQEHRTVLYNRTSYARSAEMRLDFNRPQLKKALKRVSMQVLQGRVEPAGQKSRGQKRASVCYMCILTCLPCFHCSHISCLQKEHLSLMSEYIYAVMPPCTEHHSSRVSVQFAWKIYCDMQVEMSFPGQWRSSHYTWMLCELSPAHHALTVLIDRLWWSSS